MVSPTPAGAQSAEKVPVAEIVRRLAVPAQAPLSLDTSYFSGSTVSRNVDGPAAVLLPEGYRWRQPGADAPKVPLQLCEFLAYKTALAYESEERVLAYLRTCHDGISRPKFFDSARTGASSVGKLADAQGFGFVFERKAFVIFRGTTSSSDWKMNRSDVLTDVPAADPRMRALAQRYGHLVTKLGKASPGRHMGFSIAWAALKDEVEDWLADAIEAGEVKSIVYSGHSLGGAMAQVAAFDHARIEDATGRDRAITPGFIGGVVTFGAPLVGNAAFAKAYDGLLGDRTVRFESSGDLVPRIMQRWYYRMLYPLRQRVQAGLHMYAQQDRSTFAPVGLHWPFSNEPPLAPGDIDDAVRNLGEAAARALREANEKLQKAAKEAEEKKERERKAQEEKAAREPQATPAGESAGKKEAAADPGKAKPDEPAPTWVYWVVGGVVVLAVAGVVWYFVRRKLFSHDIEQRYALYLSTLSYQQLRAKHGGNLARAHDELDRHLAFVRGDFVKSHTVDGGKRFFSSVQALPVRIAIKDDPHFLAYLDSKDTFV